MIDQPKDITAAEVAAIRRRAEAATPGPWHVRNGYYFFEQIPYPAVEAAGWVVAMLDEGNQMKPPTDDIGRESQRVTAANAEFIAHARTDIPALCDALEAREKQLAALQAPSTEARDLAKKIAAIVPIDNGPGCGFVRQRITSDIEEVLAPILSQLRSQLAAMQRERDEARWRSTADEMPEIQRDVLVVIHRLTPTLWSTPTNAIWDGAVWANDDWHRDLQREEIDFWMPMPSLPAAALVASETAKKGGKETAK